MPLSHGQYRFGPRGYLLAAALFVVLSTLNVGGYRYGASDQAFYLPAVERHVVPDAFPRDRVVIDTQDHLNVFTAVIAAGVTHLGVPVEGWFGLTFFSALLLIGTAIVAVGHRLGFSTWAQLAAVAALTLRHRVGVTGANTHEAYGHPRMLAFGIGLWAVQATLAGRTWPAIGLIVAAGIVHPTTACWFALWVGTALLLSDRGNRRWMVPAAGVAAVAAVWAIWFGPFAGRMVPIDAEWRAVLATKDYVFPHQWTIAGWGLALLYVAVVSWAVWARHRAGCMTDEERGLAGGLAALPLVFAITLPLSALGYAFFVQLQVSRVFWMLDVMGTIYLAGAAVDGWARRDQAPVPSTRRAVAVTTVIFLLAASRGVYIKWVQHPERPVVAWSLPATPWQDAMTWLRRTPLDTLVLADPGHAWKYGTSVRVAASRDVVLEEVKDAAISMYARPLAIRTLERIRACDGYDHFDTAAIAALAHRYGAHYIVDERTLSLPVAYRNSRFTIYDVRMPPDQVR